MKRVKYQHFSLIPLSCVHILVPQVPRKKTAVERWRFLVVVGGGFTTKLNVAVSAEFVLLRFTLIAEQCHDITQASALIDGYLCEYVIADAADDSDAFRSEITAQDAEAVICPRKNRVEDRPYDKVIYKLRNVVQRFFIG